MASLDYLHIPGPHWHFDSSTCRLSFQPIFDFYKGRVVVFFSEEETLIAVVFMIFRTQLVTDKGLVIWCRV